jgi:hypothetical protein
MLTPHSSDSPTLHGTSGLVLLVTKHNAEPLMRSLLSRFAKPTGRRDVRRREVFSAQLDGGKSAAAYGTTLYLGYDMLERRIVLTASESDFIFSQGTITGYQGAGGSVEIPSSIYGIPVVVIGEKAFANKPELTRVVIPNSVILIGTQAFEMNSALVSVKIGNNVTHIGYAAFSGNTSLKSVSIPNSVTIIDALAFYGGTSLASVKIGTNVSTIGDSAFSGNTSLKSVTIPNSVIYINGNAFSGNTALKSVNIGNRVNYIGDGAFSGNTSLKSVTIPNSVRTIAGFAFYGNTSMTSLTIGNRVTLIGNSAFEGNTGLKSVTIPDSVRTIDDWAFAGNTSLTQLKIGNQVTSIGRYTFCFNTSLKSVSIPDSVRTIGSYAFEGNTGLTRLAIGNKVTAIGDYAFSLNTSLKSVTIPGSVRTIGDNAFHANFSLDRIRFMGNAPSVGNDVFKYVPFFAKAIRSAGLTGYGGNGDIWNGLIVWTPGRVAAPTVTPSYAALGQNAATMTITGTGFVAGKPSAHQVTFQNGVVGTVTAATASRLTVTFLTPPTWTGPLEAIVMSVGGTSGFWKQVATIVEAPTVTAITAELLNSATTMTIMGNGFNATTPSANNVAFNLGVVGSVTAATATRLTVTFSTQPISSGPLTAIVTSFGGTSGVATQVATVVSAYSPEVPFPELPLGAGPIDSDAPKSFTTTTSGLRYRVLRQGSGAKPSATGTVTVNYQGWLDDGKVVDSNNGISFKLTQVISGWTEGMQLVGKGGMIEMAIPSNLAYGSTGAGGIIPPNATTHWLVELLDVQ